MTSPRPSRTLYVVLVALLVLVPLLAILQYRWIGAVSQAARLQLEEHLHQDGAQLADDFDRELARILNMFQVRGSVDRPDISAWFAQRYDDAKAASPNLVQRVFLARRSNTDLELMQFNPQSRSLESVEWPAEFAPVKQTIEARLDRIGRQRVGVPREALKNGSPVFMVPAVPDIPRNSFERSGFRQSARGGFSIIELNSRILYDDFIPSVVVQHFAAGTNAQYVIAIVSSGPNPRIIYKSDAAFNEAEMQKPDLRIPLFGPEPGSRLRPFGGGMRGLALAGNWELLVRHRSGSLDAAIASARNRDLAVAFSVLLMLALSVVLVVVLSHRARALAQLQMDFVARVSHELRTPLAIIRSAAYNLVTGVVSDERGVREYASMVQCEGQRLSTMVDQILTFSRTETGGDAYDLRAIDVDQIVDRVMSNMSGALNAAGCAVDRRIASDLPKVKADERAFAECLQNLVTNAIKYGCSENAARIQLEARRDNENTVVVCVADSGPGIDNADLEQIFEPFFRGKNAGSDTPGSGLGLNLVRRMMSAQGGRVTVESQPGQGTRFTLHLSAISEAPS